MANAIVSRSQIFKASDNHDLFVEKAVKQVNELLTDANAKFPLFISEDVIGPYGTVQSEVLSLIKAAGWTVLYKLEQRAFLIS